MSLKSLILLTLIVSSFVSYSQQNTRKNKDEIEKYLNALETYGNAGQVLIADRGQIILNKSYGYADREHKKPVTDQTIFELASVSKLFTAVAILRLEMDGKLKVTDSLGNYLDNVPTDKQAITIHHLLTHSSGIRGGDLISDFQSISKSDFIKRILNTPLRSKPGQKWSYSNAGFNLLAAIIEKQSGKSYDAYLRETFFIPLGMNNSGVTNTPFLNGKPVAIAYQGNKNMGSPDRQTFNPRTWGGGSVCSTVSDMFIWERALRSGKIINQPLLDKMFTKQIAVGGDDFTYYGYGCFVYKAPPDNRSVIDHGGDTDRGFNATFRMFMDDDRTYLFVSNAKQPGGTWDRWFVDARIKALISGVSVKLPPAVKPLTDKALNQYSGIYQNDQSQIKISVLGGNLIADAEGQGSVELLYNFSNEDKAKIQKVQENLIKILTDYKNKTTVGLREFLSEEGMKDFIQERDMLLEKFGSLKSFHITGTIPDSSNPSFWICSAKLEYERKTVHYFSMWMVESLEAINLDFATADMESNVNRTFVCTGKDIFTNYNFFSDSANAIEFKRDAAGNVTGLAKGDILFLKKP